MQLTIEEFKELAQLIYAEPITAVAYKENEIEEKASDLVKQQYQGKLKPPLGLKPRYIAYAERKLEVLEAICRYVKDGKEVPKEWVDELNE